ncbi:CsbD family protein [Vallicoccus soli]|uniref:CsbD family protein n=1 Tax=Vallicoccus soli TaxID=2339232 RepID=A0A3A3YQ96_9ACTN|nr:CsbD family protein [Vallicoccus soli]RJK93403.1 CsbD family protein [Vallicoccus soli]
MSGEDKTQNKVDEIQGRAKQQVGSVTGDEDLQREGKADESKANLKQAGEKLKDAFK